MPGLALPLELRNLHTGDGCRHCVKRAAHDGSNLGASSLSGSYRRLQRGPPAPLPVTIQNRLHHKGGVGRGIAHLTDLRPIANPPADHR